MGILEGARAVQDCWRGVGGRGMSLPSLRGTSGPTWLATPEWWL